MDAINDYIVKMQKAEDKIIITFVNDIKDEDEIDAEKVFEKFYKADKSRTQNSTGLGLAIAKDIAGKLDGEISAKVENGLFYVELWFG